MAQESRQLRKEEQPDDRIDVEQRADARNPAQAEVDDIVQLQPRALQRGILCERDAALIGRAERQADDGVAVRGIEVAVDHVQPRVQIHARVAQAH